jgi:hypothetical protein
VGRRVVVRFGEKKEKMPSWLASFSQNIFQNNFQKYIKEKREVQERFENGLKQNFQKLDSLA